MNKIPKSLILFRIKDFLKVAIVNLSLLNLFPSFFESHALLKFIIIFGIYVSLFRLLYSLIHDIFFFSWSIHNEYLTINNGIFTKREFKLSYKKILGANFNQPFFYRLLKMNKVTIYLPSTGDRSKLTIPVMNNSQLAIFKQWSSKRKGAEVTSIDHKNTNQINPVSKRKMFISSFFTFNYLFVVTIFFTASDIVKYIGIDLQNLLQNFYEHESNKVIFGIIVFIFTIVATIIKQYINYSYFSIMDSENEVETKNGILNIDSIKIHKEDISGFMFSQTLGQVLLKLNSVKAIIPSVEKNERKIKNEDVLPYQSIDETREHFTTLFPKWSLNYPFSNKGFSKKQLCFFIWTLICFIYLAWTSFEGFEIAIIYFISYKVMMLACQKLNISNGLIYIEHGIFKRTVIVMKVEHIEWAQKTSFPYGITFSKIALRMKTLKKYKFVGKGNANYVNYLLG